LPRVRSMVTFVLFTLMIGSIAGLFILDNHGLGKRIEIEGGVHSLRDLDGNGDLELITSEGMVYDYEEGVFSKIDSIPDFYPPDSLLEDLNNDGLLDILAVERYEYDHVTYLNRGDFSFEKVGKIESDRRYYKVDTINIDDDGHPDIFTISGNWITFLRNNGDGSFEEIISLNSTYYPFQAAFFGDGNEVGRP